VTGAVDAEVDDGSGSVRGYGDLVVVSLPSVGAARRLARAVAAAEAAEGARIPEAFERADLSVDVRVRGVSVARVGPAARAGALGRRLSERLGVAASVSLGGVLRSLFR
jgi:hypothetical protein